MVNYLRHTHTDTHFGTRAWTTDTNADEHIPQRTHIYICACTHTHIHIIIPHPVRLVSLISIQILLYSPKLIVCNIRCEQHLFSHSGTIHSADIWLCVCICLCACIYIRRHSLSSFVHSWYKWNKWKWNSQTRQKTDLGYHTSFLKVMKEPPRTHWCSDSQCPALP